MDVKTTMAGEEAAGGIKAGRKTPLVQIQTKPSGPLPRPDDCAMYTMQCNCAVYVRIMGVLQTTRIRIHPSPLQGHPTMLRLP